MLFKLQNTQIPPLHKPWHRAVIMTALLSKATDVPEGIPHISSHCIISFSKAVHIQNTVTVKKHIYLQVILAYQVFNLLCQPEEKLYPINCGEVYIDREDQLFLFKGCYCVMQL